MNSSLINKSFNYQLFRPTFTSSSLRLGTNLCRCLALSVRRIRSQACCCRVSAPRSYSSSHSGTFMEVVKAVGRQGSAAPDSVAIRADQQSYSYRQIISSAVKISNFLNYSDIKTPCEARKDENPSLSIDGMGKQRHLGGARIGIVAKPSAEFVAGILGTWFSGGVAVPLALSYPEAELLHVMNDSDISMVLSTNDHRELLQEVASKCAAQFSIIPPVPSTSSLKNAHDHSHPGEIDELGILRGSIENSSEDPALIIYTSGTTGKPKGVVHTHRSITAQVQTLTEAWEYTSADQFLHSLPLHHVHGLFNALLAPLYAGSTVEFMPKFSVRGIWQRWRESYPVDGTRAEDAITVFTGVPTMYTRLIQGYEAMDPELQVASASAARELRLMFVMSISNPLKAMRKPGTVGKPFPGVQVKILTEDENGDNTDGVGELCVKSPSLFKEYWKLPEVTKESFIDGGFFKTGDAGRVDEDGYYVILGRTSADIMKVGGYKLSALEIESTILEHPVVAECCVLGLPDKDYGEAVCAIIVHKVDAKVKQEEDLKPAISLKELRSWAKEKLAPYKLPTKLYLWDSLPRNAMGKVNKKELKKVLAAKQ
ncbi:probable CoA ligase CCL8 isoform X2 [Quercus robur]|uniref:probable CoA ligase CCL8 isoform X2 n=1 Tax=Quercus robur TaxID=38942 RepID=UPI002163BBAD|nr:probable CoA ligase CCL8 isoform X2 [Quercus robur]